MATKRTDSIPCSRKAIYLWLALSLGSLAWTNPSLGQAAVSKDRILHADTNYDEIDFYLITIGLGEELYTRFGHTILRIKHRSRPLDESFNWGLFDFEKPHFAWNFFKGRLDYFLGVMPTQRLLQLYRRYEKRSAWQEKINLTVQQKRFLGEKILWNLQPENLEYRYQYFFDNCSTRLRDFFDLTLNGAIKAEYGNEITPRVHRDWVRSNLATSPFIVMSLDILMNSDIDRPLSAWHEMFLPIKLREYLMAMPAFDDDGKPIAGLPLLSESIELLKFEERADFPLNGYHFFAIFFGLAVAWLTAQVSYRKIDAHHGHRYMRSIGLALAFYGLFAAVFGIIMIISWMLSEHTDLHHNANLLMFWPTDFLLLYLGIKLLRRGTPFTDNRLSKSARVYLWLHLLALAAFTLLSLMGVITQNVNQILLFIAPVMALLLATVLRQGFHAGFYSLIEPK